MGRLHFPGAALLALAAAALFGASTPLAKQVVGEAPPMLLAGLLYLASGLGLGLFRLLRDRGWKASGLRRGEWPWLLGAIGFGGVLGPTLLMVGLSRTPASTASLLLNLEAVLTALLAWLAFRENAGARVVLGMALIVGGGLWLSWQPAAAPMPHAMLGALAIAGACLCWAIDNNLTRKVSTSDALFVAASKGWVAGVTNTGLMLALGAAWPSARVLAQAGLIGLFGYGVSLVLFVLALRQLGAARTSAYFSIAPFIGAALSILIFRESVPAAFWFAAGLMAAGVWLHLTERHEHEHTHAPLDHTHWHVHDEHHQHEHDFPWDGREPHSHPHHHAPLTHIHPHYPDIHHQHSH